MKVLACNALASIQDLGRFGYRSMGVGKNGVMDRWAFEAGNALIKNSLNEPTLEITLGSLTLEFTEDTAFCITGAIYEAYLDDKRIACYWRINAKAGQTLKLVRSLKGMYSYLCVHGGFDVKPILNSSSTNDKADFGGFKGRMIQENDTINIKTSAHLPVIGVIALPDTRIIRVVKNSEYDCFTSDSQKLFFEQSWKIETSSNRMGYRFKGEKPLELGAPLQMSSHGVDIGMIQVPPQGQPIVLMADAQTTGGYPKIASVIDADIGLLAQIRYGKECQFQLVTIEDALEQRQQRQRYIARIKEYAHEN
ncbi:biotin-dependent carboxyltransferase family protein [uncultured Psychrobacter sp.]|uniref:5-oxoprolinase subunit C family protein n=1 Tax=uncultured Psychrobacter sp. TaxID=259303 RepID=UPI003458B3A5